MLITKCCLILNYYAPVYICEIVAKYDKCMLVVPKSRTNGYGARFFLYISAMLWNYLCDDCLTEADSVAVFEGRLKTVAYDILTKIFFLK